MTCNRCNQLQCTCGPSPFYTSTPMCKEDSTCFVYNPSFFFSLCPQNEWNVPAIGASATLEIPGIKGISVGAYLWKDTFGYYKITAIDVCKGTISIVNIGTQGNASPGTQIPPCTCFILTDTPPNENGSNCNIALAVSFTAPANGGCLDITLTSVAGLIAGNNIQIGEAVYVLSAIKANEVVTICNEGQGFPVGMSIIAKNPTTGDFNYCVSQLSINPCDNTPVARGNVVVCSEGNLTTLSGDQDGEILILLNHITGEVGFGISTPCCEEQDSQVQGDEPAAVSGTIEAGDPFPNLSSNAASVTFINPSNTVTMNILFNIMGSVLGSVNLNAGAVTTSEMEFRLSINPNGAGYTVVQDVVDLITDDGNALGLTHWNQTVAYSFIITVPPLTTYNLQAIADITTFGPDYVVQGIISRITAIGVAV